MLLAGSLSGQVYTLGDNATGTIATCSGKFYDPGGVGANYSNSEIHSVTFTTGDATKVMVVDFTFWNLESHSGCAWDQLAIYDGTSTTAPLLGIFCTNAPPRRITASGASLHFRFVADNAVNAPGWEADIYCIDLPCETAYYKDEFAARSYNLSNGTEDWTGTSWTETNDDGSVSSGDVQQSGGFLRMDHDDATLPSLERAVDLTGASSATLSYVFVEGGGKESNDLVYVEVYDGTTWHVVQELRDDFPPTSTPYARARTDISAYANANTKVRFRIVSGYSGNSEFIYFDDVEVCFTTGSSTDFYLEAECGYVGSSWSTLGDADASEGLYVESKVGLNFLGSPPSDTLEYLTYVVEITDAGDYELYNRVITPSPDDNSFWVRVNGGDWIMWNNLPSSSLWAWHQVWDSDLADAPVSFALPVGTTRIDIAYREDGTKLDKLFLTLDGTAPSGLGEDANNCPSNFLTDTDGDGIIDGEDLDDDNDGILDVDESPATITFSNSRNILVGYDLGDLKVSDVVVYNNAVRDCDDIRYDITIEVTSISPGVNVEASPDGMIINNASASDDDHFTFTLSVVESGSATAANPSGTSATINNFLFTPRDIDSNDGVDHTEVLGINNLTPANSVFFAPSTVLEVGGFVNGSGPGAGYTYYRMRPISGVNDWTANGNDTSQEDPNFAVFMLYNNFSSVQLAYGRTGDAPSTSAGSRLTSLFASKECDRDGDGVPNTVDLDLDNDGIFDLYEAGHTQLDVNDDGRIDGADTGSGANGVFDGIETAAESGVLNYSYSDNDGSGIEDPFDRDSDEDGCFDTEEAGIPDADVDGVAGSGTPGVDVNGLVVFLVYDEPPSNAWQDSLQSCLEICDNGLDDDGDGLIDENDADCANYYLEAECGFPGANWTRGFDVEASNDDYLTISTGLNSTVMPPPDADDLVRFTVNVTAPGLYRILARVYAANGADDSFWIRVDNGTWYNWNDWNTDSNWKWLPVEDNDNGNTLVKWNLLPGNHTIDIAYREDGARIDKLHLTINGTTPTGDGEDAINCGRTITYNLFLPALLLNK